MENLFDLYGKKSYTFVIIMDESKLYKKGDDTVLHYYFDPTYILVIIGIIISMAASANVNGSFRKYSRVLARRGVRAEQAAETILRNAGIYDVTIQHVSGNLTYHYDPRSKTLRLSDSVYGSSSVSAIGVAAHECGHAIQHDSGYVPLKLRGALVPVVNFASRISMPMILLGLILGYAGIAQIGVILFAAVLIFQLVTLPVEFNASSRAIRVLGGANILYEDEVGAAKKVLRAAALTYIASALATALQLFRLILLTNRRRN